MAAKVISVINQKGGVGKTTISVTLGYGLARRGKNVLLIDLDPQGQAASSLRVPLEPGVMRFLSGEVALHEVVRKTGRERLHLLPGDKSTAVIQNLYVASAAALGKQPAVDRLLRDLQPAVKAQGLDYLILDTGPTLGVLHEMAIWASAYVLVPTQCQYKSLEGVYKELETLKQLTARGWKGKLLGIQPTMLGNTRLERELLEQTQERFGEFCLPPIHRANAFEKASAAGIVIYELAGADCDEWAQRGQDEMDALVRRVIKVTS